MKRWIFTILLFLLLGAIVNIAVAWGCALYFDPYANVGRTLGVNWDPGDGRAGAIDRYLAPASTVTYVLMWDDPSEFDLYSAVEDPSAFLPHWLDKSRVLTSLQRVINSSDPRARLSFDGTGVVVDERGWPCRSLWLAYTPVVSGTVMKMRGAIVFPHRTSQDPTGRGYPWGYDSMSLAHVPPALPLRPILLGFLVNTIFYTIILWLLIPCPFVLRRHIRLKRGRCPKCGYDLRGKLDAGCPECGWNRQPAPGKERVAPGDPGCEEHDRTTFRCAAGGGTGHRRLPSVAGGGTQRLTPRLAMSHHPFIRGRECSDPRRARNRGAGVFLKPDLASIRRVFLPEEDRLAPVCASLRSESDG